VSRVNLDSSCVKVIELTNSLNIPWHRWHSFDVLQIKQPLE